MEQKKAKNGKEMSATDLLGVVCNNMKAVNDELARQEEERRNNQGIEELYNKEHTKCRISIRNSGVFDNLIE